MKLQLFQKLLLTSFVCFAFAIAPSSQARTLRHLARKSHFTQADSVRTSAAASSMGDSVSNYRTRYGFGFASAYNLTASSTALTGWIGLSPKFGIQPLLSVGSTSPFQFAAGAIGKYTLAGNERSGFHVGGGIAFGSTHKGASGGGFLFGNSGASGASSGFLLGLSALAGVHFTVPGTSNIMVHFDGGANFGVVDGDTDFNLGGTIGSLLGASIIYVF